MEILEEYIRQQSWRNWVQYLKHIPLNQNHRVLDLGCSVGAVSSLLAANCANVIGIDINPEFIGYCQSQALPNQQFICADFKAIDSGERIDGVWSSFSLSYLPDPATFVKGLAQHMAKGSWIALVDVSCFISGNLPRSSNFYPQVRKFERRSSQSGVYDFDFGSKLVDIVTRAGFSVIYDDDNVVDAELNFDGIASPEIYKNWQARIMRMRGLRLAFPDCYESICSELLANLQSEEHARNKNVRFVVGIKNE
jgi:SAM-dependent methyltransferase